MRITLHLDTFDTDPCAFAILWLDDHSLKWSREAHLGLALPAWGIARSETGRTLIFDPSGTQPLCILEGMELSGNGGPFEGEVGRAYAYTADGAKQMLGDWHVQCIDHETTQPEFGLFADDQAAWSDARGYQSTDTA